MSQIELAQKLGVAQSYVSRVESGSENITIAVCKRFARAVGCVFSISMETPAGVVAINMRGIENVTLATCERLVRALGGVFHDNFTKK